MYEKSFERLVNSQEKVGNGGKGGNGGVGYLLRKVKIEYDRQISILTAAAFRRRKTSHGDGQRGGQHGGQRGGQRGGGGISFENIVRNEQKDAAQPPIITTTTTNNNNKDEKEDHASMEAKMERMRIKIDHQQRELSNYKQEQQMMLQTVRDKNDTIDEMQRTTIQWKTWAKKRADDVVGVKKEQQQQQQQQQSLKKTDRTNRTN